MLLYVRRIFIQILFGFWLLFVSIDSCLPTTTVTIPTTTEEPTSSTTEMSTSTEDSSSTTEMSSTTEVSTSTVMEFCLADDVKRGMADDATKSLEVKIDDYSSTTTNGATTATMTISCEAQPDFYAVMSFSPDNVPITENDNKPLVVTVQLICRSETNQWLYMDTTPVESVSCTEIVF
ncbi:unnamed protein product [Caenorhabditis brenneri]